MTTVLNLAELQCSKIQCARKAEHINLYYKETDQPAKQLYIKTGCWTCPFGCDDQGRLMVIIPDNTYFKMEELDKYGQRVCKYFLTKEREQAPDVNEDLPYKPLIQKIDGMDVIILHKNGEGGTKVFDSNGIKLEDDQAQQWISGQFSGNFLIAFSLRVWDGGAGAQAGGYYYWSTQILQIKIRRHCTLPQGCQIFDSEDALQTALDMRQKVKVIKQHQEDEAVVDFDPDVNELLD